MSDFPLARDPYSDPTPVGGARTDVIVRETVTERPRRERAIEPGRLERAGLLLPFVEQVGPRQFRVKGHDEPEYGVNLDSDEICGCRDAYYRTLRCKHQLVCEIIARDPMVLLAFGQLLLRKQEHAKELHRQVRAVRRTVRKAG